MTYALSEEDPTWTPPMGSKKEEPARVHAHVWEPSEVPPYERCRVCETMHRTDRYDPDAMYGTNYWDDPARSTMEEQVYNLEEWRPEGGAPTKCEAILEHCGEGDSVLEIGCAPGVLLRELRKRFIVLTGVEYALKYRARVEAVTGGCARLVFGPFPTCMKDMWHGVYDTVVAMDVLEHVEDGQAFMQEVCRLLKPDGRCVMMMPALLDDGLFNDRMYCDEHRFIYSQAYLSEWLGPLFERLEFGRWVPGHELVVAHSPLL